MRIRTGPFRLTHTLTILAIVGVALSAAPIPPGRQHRLTIEGENTVTFAPEANLPDLKIDYKARFEYIVDTWEIKEPRPPSDGLSKP